jgi:hypothetical protein
VQRIAARISLLMRQKTADIDRILGVKKAPAPAAAPAFVQASQAQRSKPEMTKGRYR